MSARRLRRERARAALPGLAALCLLGASSTARAAAPPPRASDPVADPGRSLASSDDTSAIAGNPANLAFLPAPELRWSLAWTGSTSPQPNRGMAFGFGLPIGPFATGLRLDLLSPPDGAPAPFDANYHWLRWGLAVGTPMASFGTTIGWGFSKSPLLDGYLSLTSGITSRLLPWLSASFAVRDWNAPISTAGLPIERSWQWGLALRPFQSRAVEAGFDVSLFEKSESVAAHGTLGVNLPRVGRLRGDLTVFPESSRRFLAMAGVEVNVDRLQASAGGIFGNAVGHAGTGFYLGAAYRGFREAGIPLPRKVVRLHINETPGVRGNTRFLKKLWRLAEDPEVAGVVLQLRAEPASTLAHAEEIADAVRGLRARGKKVLCHLEDAGSKSLFVCAQADRIAMNPAGGLRFAGLTSSYMYFGGTLKKLGVKADFVRIGDHKGAAEQYTLPASSPVAESDHQELVDKFEEVYLHDVGGGRRIALQDLKARIAKGPFLAGEARDAGLVDTLAYSDEIERVADEMMGGRVRVVDDDNPPRPAENFGETPKVAVVYLTGDMVDGDSQFIPLVGIKLAGSTTVARALRRAREDASVKSVVFRIETGGGSSLAADVILREAILTARVKPLIVSMGSSAASGGYYASVGAREIFANRTTITGSIGIFYGKVDVSGLLDRLGVHIEQYRSAPRADAESLYRPFTDAEHVELAVKVKQFYDTFIARVAEGRHLRPEAVDAVARGKVWTGAQAVPIGLVDHLGGLREALEEARRLGSLPNDAPFIESPEEDDSLLGVALKLVGITSAGISPSAALAFPPVFLDLARSLTPFLVFESQKPLARSEIVESEPGDEKGP